MESKPSPGGQGIPLEVIWGKNVKKDREKSGKCERKGGKSKEKKKKE
jgi:hypothetical protein